MQNLTLYCNAMLNSVPRHTQYNQKNLICAAHQVSNEDKSKLSNCFFDDTNDNISTMNRWLGDLTGLYWVWKNTTDEYVGTNQYRRFWVEESMPAVIDDNTLYVTSPYVFQHSILEQYTMHHGNIGLHILYEAASQNRISMLPSMVQQLGAINHISACNMFFGHRRVFNQVCEKLFGIIFELYDGVRYALPYIQPETQHRMIAFLAERILTLMYLHKDHFFDRIDIQYVDMKVIL